MDDYIYFLSEKEEQDAAGVFHSVTARRGSFCKISSVSRSEFYNAGRSGLNPDYEATVFAMDYQGEKLAEFNGMTYSIYRTYRVPGTDYMELYMERRGGSNGLTRAQGA